jgi:hypothetical protein
MVPADGVSRRRPSPASSIAPSSSNYLPAVGDGTLRRGAPGTGNSSTRPRPRCSMRRITPARLERAGSPDRCNSGRDRKSDSAYSR